MPPQEAADQSVRSPRDLIGRLRSLSSPQGTHAQLVSGTVGSAILKLLSLALTTGTTVLLARVLAPEGYGVYALGIAAITILGIPSQIGLPTLVMREAARYQVKEEWGLLRGLLTRSSQLAITASLLIAIGTVLALVVAGESSSSRFATMQWALLLLPLMALAAIRSGALRGLGRVVVGQIPELLARPALHLLLIAGVVVIATPTTLTAPLAMALHAVAAFAAFVVGTVLLARVVPGQVALATPLYDTRAWLRTIGPLSLLGGVQLISSQSDIVILSVLRTDAEVGLYRVAVQFASFVMVAATIVNASTAPLLARLYAQGELDKMEQVAQRGATLLFTTAVLLGGVLVLFAPLLLEVVLGPEYVDSRLPLTLLAIGGVIAAEQGPVVTLMNMTGNERTTVRAIAVGAVANVALSILFVPAWGMGGAAAATVLSTCLWRVLLVRQVESKLGVNIGAIRQLGSILVRK